MKLSVSIPKITAPHLPNILYRSRLIDLLERNREKKLILILGQAAQGKSTLAASYVKMSGTPSAWINLDKEDSNSVNLYYLIIQSLQHAMRDIDFSSPLSYRLETMEPMSEISLFREWTESIFKNVATPIQIVLDGLDRLSNDTPAFQFLQALVEDSPTNIHFLMLARGMPPPSLEFQHLKMRQEAIVVTNEEIAFTRDEMNEFFHKIRKIPFNADQLKKIFAVTDGWIGGLILFAESLERLPESTREKFISEGLPDNFRREVFQYLGKEILSSQPGEIQQFLIKSSLIDFIEPGFIKELIGIEGAEEILRDHVRKNLFVQSFYDDKKGWLFRYHQLFRAFLKTKFITKAGEGERQSLLFKAGGLYEQRGELGESVKYYLEAKAYGQAVSVIERIGMDLLKMERTGDLSQWIQSLPGDIVQGNPWLLLYLSVTRRFTRVDENILNLQKAFTIFEEKGDVRGLLLSLAFLIKTSFIRGHDLIPLGFLLEQAERLLQLPNAEWYPYERANLIAQMGLGLTLRAGNPRKGFLASQNAYLMSKELGDFQLQIHSLVNAVKALSWLGEFALADEKCKEFEKLLEKYPNPGVRRLYQTVLYELSLGRGDFDQARDLIQLAQNEAEKHGLTYLYSVTMVYDLMLKPHFEQYKEAEEIGNRLLSLSNSTGNLFLTGVALLFLSRNFYYKGEVKKAREYLKQSHQLLSSDRVRSEYHLYFIYILDGFISSHLPEDESPEKKSIEENLQTTLEKLNSISSFIAVDAHFATALFKWGQAKTDEVIAHLEAGLKIAENKKYHYFTFTSPRDLLKICLLSFELEVKGVSDYTGYLLSRALVSLSDPELKELALHPNSKIRKEAWEIRRAIHRSKIPPLLIETLGGFQVFHGQSPMKETEWDRSQPKHLLKAIVSYGGQRIPKEILMDELWPDESPAATEKNFKTTLQRLRKSLEPSIHKDFSSSYIHLHDNFVFLDPELCQVDADLFLSLLKKADEMEKKGDRKGALSVYTEAMEIYRGDFLPDELYAPWADKRREELRAKYIKLLNKVASLYERQGALKKAMDCYKKAIQADPLLEESYQKLMALYSSKGMYNETLKTYEACKKALKAELKTIPDAVTTSLYEKTLERIAKSEPKR